MVEMLGYLETSRRLGVSDTAVRKHLQRALAQESAVAQMPFI